MRTLKQLKVCRPRIRSKVGLETSRGTIFQFSRKLKVLNDKITIIVNLQYRKGFLVLVPEKGMEILYYFKPFNANYKKGRLITSYAFLVVLS